jgi:hypothetical protein
MNGLFGRAGYGFSFLGDLGRVPSTTLPKRSVEEAADLMVRCRRMEVPAQEWPAEKMIRIANRPIRLSTLRSANSGDYLPTSVAPSMHLTGIYENLNRIGTNLEQ